MAAPVTIRDMRVRLFTDKQPPFEHPELLRFHNDLLAGSRVVPQFHLLEGGYNNAYHDMSVLLLEESGLDQIMGDVDVLLLAYHFPNIRPDISIVNYLMDRYQARFLSFAVNDMGFGAPFAALHMLQHYLNSGNYDRGMLLVLDQTSLPYETEGVGETVEPDTGAVLVLDRSAECGSSLVGVEIQYAESSIAETAELLLDRFCAQVSVNPAQIRLLVHPLLEQEVSGTEWFHATGWQGSYDPAHWSAAPFFGLKQLLEERCTDEYICLMHLEPDDKFIYALLIHTGGYEEL
ncbi:hypothetical protein [Paenibacillus sp. SAF-068]|uniref:hypothetical protein n=1 Tax=Paenibacillus sp. SAF-068 TaxID=3436864 RepID=UPI003F7F953B